MKPNKIYILILLAAVAAVLLVATGRREKKMDERITLRRQDKIPYGTWVAYRSLPYLFPGASVYTSRHEPGYWDSVSLDDPDQAFIAITDAFNADDFELQKLIAFAENGNDVFISARDISSDAERMIRSAEIRDDNTHYTGDNGKTRSDSLRLTLLVPSPATYSYPGKNFSSFFSELNTATADILGRGEEGAPDFIHLRAGKGNFYIHLAPLAFSNYFLLHGNNISYYEKAFSVISPRVKRIIWDEYYLTKREDYTPRNQKTSWIKVLSRYPAFKAALLTAIFTLVMYVLLEMRRKQRPVPVVTKPRNDSLDFVKTIGRLYYEKADHRNLAQKMAAYFLEHVRSKYKLPTGTLDESFIKNLQFKTGVEEMEIRGIVSFIKYAHDAPALSPAELSGFHRQLESFYKKA